MNMTNSLKAARVAAGMTAFALANAAGTREPRIYSFERERYNPSLSEAKAIAKVLCLNPAELFPRVFGKRAM